MNEGEEIQFIDLFSGIGGFRLGLDQSGGFRCVWSCDNNKYANQIYTKQYGEANHHPGDIRGVHTEDIPNFDLLCAGFPCQSFSVAGKGKGFQDTRGTLFFEISRIAEAKRPQTLLLENVKGLLSNDRGQTFQTILQELGRIGYWSEWQIFNSKHHGVPQNRERVFIIGHLRNGHGREIFPIGETDEVAKRKSRGRSPVQLEVSTAIDGSYYKGVDRHGQRTVVLDTFNRGAKEEEAYSLKTNPSPTSSAVIAIRPKDDWFSQHAIHPSKGVSPTLRGNQNDPSPRIAFVSIGSDKPTVRKGGRGSLDRHAWDTLTDGFRIRRLTPVECERLQGFPSGWTEWGIDEDGEKVKISDTQRYRALGNAVTTNVITFLGKRIMEAEK